MAEHNLGQRTWTAEQAEQRLPRVVLTIPLAHSDLPIIGLAAKMNTSEHEVWQLHALWDAPPVALARLLAILLLDDTEPIMHFQLMPTRPPTAMLLKSGQIRQGRGRFLAPWALAEIDRLAQVLRERHSSYLSDLAAALNQESAGGFRPLPSGMIFADTISSARIGPPPPEIETDLSQSERVRFDLKWNQIIVQGYCRNRYLALLSDEQLGRRVEGIVGNMHTIDSSGLVSVDKGDPALSYWLSLLTEVQVEMALRHGPYPAGWKRGMIDFGNMPGSITSAGSASALTLELSQPLPSRCIIKYGRREFLASTLQDGRIRVAPASLYNDHSLNAAVRDDELSAEIEYDPSVPFNDFPPGTILFPSGRVAIRRELGTNYYVYCATDRLSTRLLLDFEGDACLIIRDVDAFLARLNEAMQKRLGGWQFVTSYVEYYDPLQVNPAEIDVLLFKHFRYAYQHEVRLGWLPPQPIKELQPIFVEVGSLEDIAELVIATPRGGA